MDENSNDKDALDYAEQVVSIAKAIVDGTKPWNRGAKELAKPLGRLMAHGDPRLERRRDEDTAVSPSLDDEEKILICCHWLIDRLGDR